MWIVIESTFQECHDHYKKTIQFSLVPKEVRAKTLAVVMLMMVNSRVMDLFIILFFIFIYFLILIFMVYVQLFILFMFIITVVFMMFPELWLTLLQEIFFALEDDPRCPCLIPGPSTV